MLKRLYVHNYKCLVNFEINFEQDISLFLGANGSGKSTVFEVLTKLRRVIIDEEKVNSVFESSDAPRWLNYQDCTVSFELDVEINNSIYKYSLVIDIDAIDTKIKEEYLCCNNEILIQSQDEKIIFSDSENSIFFNKSRSSISRYGSGSIIVGNFLQYLNTLYIVRLNPYGMVTTIYKATTKIEKDFSNFVEWLSYLYETNRRAITNFEKEIRNVLSGYEFFSIQPAGQAKFLQFEFENKANNKTPIKYYFHELSEGQKVLIALYALIYCTPDNSIICIDEPENFLALPEIQPWLNALRDQCSERNLQVILISHHPSLINFLASSSGYWFSRQDNHTRIEKIAKQDENGLSLAQLIEMGWIYGD